jgi:hypothetical protein
MIDRLAAVTSFKYPTRSGSKIVYPWLVIYGPFQAKLV